MQCNTILPMSIQRQFTLLLALILTLFCALFLTVGLMVQNARNMERAEQRRFRSEMIADELRQSSDDLTRMARLYVVTGDKKYKDYFDEIIGIRNGTIPRPEGYEMVYWDLVGEDGERPRPPGETNSIDDLMVEEGFTVEEFRKLQEARNRSDALARIETVAMNALEGRFDDGTGNFSREGEPNPELARQMMFDARYMAAKASIMEPVNEVIMMIQQRTVGEVDRLIDRGRILGWIALGLSVGSICMATSTLFVLRRRILKPLGKAMESVESVEGSAVNSPIDYASKDEMGTFVHAYNLMLGRVGNAVTELENANSQLHQQAEEIRAEKKRSDELLLNILPMTIADRLKGGETTIADTFPEVTVLFADLVGFTPLTEHLGPHEMVNVLNEIFARLDHEAERNHVEKIKTIGDAYMAVSGLPNPTADHAQNIANFALDAQESIERFARENELDVRLRVGIHSGTAVAGIIGKKRFSYDLWGDVVNVASRMESNGQPAQIQVSEPTMVRLRDLFELDPIGELDIKGKGRMNTWRLVRRRYQEAG